MIYSILFKFPASWWITSHRLLTSSTTSATFSALHGTLVKVPNNNDIVDLVLKFPASWWIISHCPFTSSTTPATFTALHGTQAFLLKTHCRVPSGSIFLRQAITLLIIPLILTLLCSLISFFFLFSSNISQVSQIEPWLGGSEYLVWLVITIDRYASRST